MRHRVYGKHLGRDKNQRTALFKGLVRSLILHESITTTAAKSKAIKGLVDRVIVKAKINTNASNHFIQEILPHKEISKKLLEEIAPRYQDRNSGFTEIVKLGNRPGDGAMIVKMSLIGKAEEKKAVKSEKIEKNEKSEEVEKLEVQPETEVKEEIKEEKKPAKKATKKEAK